MPVLTAALTAGYAIAAAQGGQAPMVVQRLGDELMVEARRAAFIREDPNQPLPTRMEFSEGVKATMGQDVLSAESLVLFPIEKRGVAKGSVKLTAPEGSISGENLEFSWAPKNKWVKGEKITAEMGGVKMTADRAETIAGDPPTFVLTKVYATPCGDERGKLVAVRSPRVEFTPGKSGVVKKPRLLFFDKPLITLPDRRFNLDPRVSGWQLPMLAWDRNDGIGMRWSSSVLIDDRTAVSGSARAFRHDPFVSQLVITRSFAKPQQAGGLITPRSDLAERFSNGFMDNIRVENPWSEDKRLEEVRSAVSLSTSWNQTSQIDEGLADEDDRYSKSIEAIYEHGQKLGPLDFQGTLRAQSIRRNEDSFHERLVGYATLGTGSIPVGRNLYARGRVDVAAFLGEDSSGWIRSETGFVITPSRSLMLSAAYVLAHEGGNPLFPIDSLRSTQATHLRLDYRSGGTELGVLWKQEHDNDRDLLEYKASQKFGCLELFVVVREEPDHSQYGLRLNLSAFLEPLKSRNLNKRNQPVPNDPRIGPASGETSPASISPHHP